MNAKTETQTLDPIADTIAEIRALTAEARKTSEVTAALERQTHAAEDVQRRLDELDAAERDAMATWAASGATGNPPSPDRTKRQKLTAELAEATATANAARAALSGVQAKALEIQERTHGAEKTLNALRLETLAARAADLGAKCREHLIEAERNRQYLIALQHFLGDRQTDDPRTRGHLDKVFAALDLNAGSLDQIARDVYQEARAHWLQAFQQVGAD